MLKLTAPAMAQDCDGLAHALADYARIKPADGIAPLLPFLPQRLLQQMAAERGQSLPELLLDMAAPPPEPLRISIEIAPMDPDSAQWHKATGGDDYALLPMQTVVTGAQGTCTTQTTAIAFDEGRNWRILDIGDDVNRANFLTLYPQFAGMPAPHSTMLCDPPQEEP
ncbi:hypothetical protein [Paracoccus sp. (in: a-proteobacteria)]|uniref:hypothetical protein n=1 Tax=Paracoccus sp. TaxID=267 RepID=UPI0026DFDE1E|nr:hypothetical protein [Paracoccus sp. (in: a-proteobacteria)]